MSWQKLELPFKLRKPALAVGADIKNRLCFAFNRQAFVNSTINDLEQLSNFEEFKKAISSLSARFDCRPKVIAYDKHPEYFCSKYALNSLGDADVKLIGVQHHHAHVVSCLLENKFKAGAVIGVAFDGTGFGSDGTLWGAEFLIADYHNFKRAAYLRYIPLLGGRRAILEPWRLSAAWLYLTFGNNFLDLNLIKGLNRKKWNILERMLKQKFNAPAASSIGRLFDAMAGIILGINRVKFEAEAAMQLEKIAARCKSKVKSYHFELLRAGDALIIDPVVTFREVVRDLKNKRKVEEIAAAFHLTLACIIHEVCQRIRDKCEINTVVLSGGVFQNKILYRMSEGLLQKAGFKILSHKLLPCTDASIALGQMAIAERGH